ncbi:MAG: ABC transporter substrate-binding protein [Candidatus Thermoplasmatota archaeon]|nr:ABC transporter substrate-binding protein [Candidatus Thermoplasmatota archaeon]
MARNLLLAAVVAVAAVVIVGAYAATVLMREDNGGSVNYLRMPPATMAASLSGGGIDGYIAWEPFVSEAIVGHTGEVLFWSEDIMPEHPCCVVAVSQDFLDQPNGPEVTKRFLKAHLEATQWMVDAMADTTSDEYALLKTLAMEFTTRNESVVEEALKHLEFRYAVDAAMLSGLETFVDMYIETNQTTLAAVQGRGYGSVEDLVVTYVNETYLEGAVSVAPASSPLTPVVRAGYLLGDLHQLAYYVAWNGRVLGGEQSLFQKYGVVVENASGAPYANGGVVMDNFAGGNVDIGYLGAPPALIKHITIGTKIVIVAQVNIEGSGLVVRSGSGIQDIEDLVNRTIATPGETSIQHLLLKIALDREGLDLVLKT